MHSDFSKFPTQTLQQSQKNLLSLHLSNANLKMTSQQTEKDIRRKPKNFGNILVVVTGIGQPSDTTWKFLCFDK